MSTTQSTSGPIRGRVEALAERISQTVETVTRNSRIFIESGDVDDINPPEDIDEYHDYYLEIGIIRANINQFVRDVVKPGVRITADDDTTEAYFMGGDDAPESAPAGGFLENCAVLAGEKRQPFYPYLKQDIVQKWTKGTTLNEYLKQDGKETDPEGPITGFKHIRPETVSARTYANTNILLEPDDIETAEEDEITKRGEAAAYVQFDDQSIVGQRRDGMDEDEVLLSQNDVLKRTIDPDIGGDDATEEGIFGSPPLEACAADAEEYRSIKRDRAVAIKKTAYGVWLVEFDTEVTEVGDDEVIVETWDQDEQDEWVSNVNDLEAGGIIGHDGSITPDQWEPTIPELDGPLEHYVADILAPLPAPKYATAFGESIANHVSDRQENSYQDTVVEERRDAERDWTQAFRAVADRHPDLDPAGLEVKIAPKESDNPIATLDDDEIEKMEQFMTALNEGLGNVPIDSVLDLKEFLQTTMDLPEDVFVDGEIEVDESAPDMQEMFGETPGEEATEADD
ncbi:hypothetical protein [Halostagnicola kamekurae]|uniref:Portal protein n=1 Tax=Halostagnicola kamekurae TaxID=619731 RepID=A0A1I6RDU4_9EURY|nr:hypothetical protein [Halostagnicola kamekurae]SFS62872.1 hypothetical protein SAMN04488556_1726 [Halostagnicola kamekurae]